MTSASDRILALDYLRGFFILVIIIDHLYRWPSLFIFLTGRGELWMSAAEGFFIISGLLVGYIRGFKGLKTPMRTLALKMVKRAATLYVWSVGLTIFLVWYCWMTTDRAGLIPYVEIPLFDWGTLLWQAITQQYTFIWIHFLKLYWIMLLLACPVVFLLRKRLAWAVVALSVAGWVMGHNTGIEWLQWQVLFFVPSAVGFYLQDITRWFNKLAFKRAILGGVVLITLVTIVVSAYATFVQPPSGALAQTIGWLFAREPLGPGRLIICAVWFSGLLALMHWVLPLIKRWFGWLLEWFGTRSLSAYILHSFVLCISQLLLPLSQNILVNTLIGAACVIATWILMRLKIVQRIVPT